MNGARLALCCVIGCLLTYAFEALPCGSGATDGTKLNGSGDEDPASATHWLEPIEGFKVNYSKRELNVRYRYPCSRQENALEPRHEDTKTKGPNILKRIGTMMMMIPVGMQLLQLPMAIASVKMSLIRSILVAKVALLMLFLRTLFMSGTREKVVIIPAPPKEHHEHYYHPFEDPEDNKPGWLGKAPAWME